MSKRKPFVNKLVLLLCLNFSAWHLKASIETPTPKPLGPCQQAEHYRHFDFWLGDWEVYGKADKSGPLFGTNTISSSQKGCLLVEDWQGTKGSTGTSVNYFDGVKGLWVQHWVSADGTVINIEGGIDEGSMVLVGKIYYANTKKQPIRDFRGTWTSLEKGVVRQFFEESTDQGQTWTPWFMGYYFPKKQL